MSHTYGGLFRRTALQKKQQTGFSDLFKGTGRINAGKTFRKQSFKFGKLPSIDALLLRIGNGGAADHVRHILDDFVMVKTNRGFRHRRLSQGLKAQSAND